MRANREQTSVCLGAVMLSLVLFGCTDRGELEKAKAEAKAAKAEADRLRIEIERQKSIANNPKADTTTPDNAKATAPSASNTTEDAAPPKPSKPLTPRQEFDRQVRSEVLAIAPVHWKITRLTLKGESLNIYGDEALIKIGLESPDSTLRASADITESSATKKKSISATMVEVIPGQNINNARSLHVNYDDSKGESVTRRNAPFEDEERYTQFLRDLSKITRKYEGKYKEFSRR